MPLFRGYPKLRERLSHIALATLPTPVQKLERVGTAIGVDRLYVKRDDLSGTVYGGNKVRKLEFLLGHILGTRAKEVLTYGFAGSNHAVATAIYSGKVGLKCTCLLMPQVNAHYVRRNLLAGFHYQARLRHYRNPSLLLLGILGQLLRGKLQTGVFPRYIPAGGSCPLGIIGYVNAAMELRDQVLAGELPEPDLLYVPLGSMGTAVGLTLGLRAVGFRTRVIPVRVLEEKMAGTRRMMGLMRKTESLLRRLDPTFPRVRPGGSDLFVRNDCLGEGYARFTEKGASAAGLMKREGGIILNGTYSAKAFSALVDDAERSELVDKTVLFWNTYNSKDLSKVTAGMDFRRIPKGFHRYFEEDVQPLDKGEGWASTNDPE